MGSTTVVVSSPTRYWPPADGTGRSPSCSGARTACDRGRTPIPHGGRGAAGAGARAGGESRQDRAFHRSGQDPRLSPGDLPEDALGSPVGTSNEDLEQAVDTIRDAAAPTTFTRSSARPSPSPALPRTSGALSGA